MALSTEQIADCLFALDYDGTLAAIAPLPEQARLVEGAGQALRDLAALGGRIAVITGRTVADLLTVADLEIIPRLTIYGVYGAQRWSAGRTAVEPIPPEFDELRRRIAGIARRAAVRFEDKGQACVVHFRGASDSSRRGVEPLIYAAAADFGFPVQPGREVLEVKAIPVGKGHALRRAVAESGCRYVCYAGDDVADEEAFAVIDELRSEGLRGRSIAVRSAEVPSIGRNADVAVNGPSELVSWLARLADRSAR